MLILTRNVGETIVINDEIKIVVLSKSGTQVRLGIEAPKDIGIHRKEVWDRIQEEKAEASS